MEAQGASSMPQPSQDAQEKARQQAENQETAKNSMISQILDQAAMQRLSNLAVAKPEKAQMVEAALINMARRGQLSGKMSDDGLKALMERVSAQTQKTTAVKFDRRRNELDSDEELDL
uniref:Programmed cell death protein 5 n=1 Tax=Caenorhabditis tropicalis TaxID=1561998 RepID=A0A1I7T927_9PELO